MITPKRGWTSEHLEVVDPDDLSYWSTSDAAYLLGGGLRPEQVRNLIRLAGISPAGKRRGLSRRGGRYIRVYSAVDLIRVYEAVSDVMSDSHGTVPGVTDVTDEYPAPEGEGSGDESEGEEISDGDGE